MNNILSQHTLQHIEKEIQYSQKEIPKARGEAQIQAQQPKCLKHAVSILALIPRYLLAMVSSWEPKISEHFLQPLPFISSVSDTSTWDDETEEGKQFQPKSKQP